MRDTTKELELEQLPGISELTVFDRFKNAKVGAIPLPTYLVMSAIIIASAYLGELPVNMLGGFAVILSLGWLLGGIGASIPGLKNFGGSAILSLMVPSIMVFMNVFNQNTLDAANMLMREANFLYFYIACLVCGKYPGDAPQDSGARLDSDDHSDGSGDDRCIDRRNFSWNFVGIGF